MFVLEANFLKIIDFMAKKEKNKKNETSADNKIELYENYAT